MPLKPAGSKFFTKDKQLAVEVAKAYWQKALRDESSKNTGKNETIADLAKLYLEYARPYYRKPDGTIITEVGNIETTFFVGCLSHSSSKHCSNA